MRLFLLTALTMAAFAANSVLNRWAVGRDLIDPVGFAQIRLVSGAAVLMGLIAIRKVFREGTFWPEFWAGRIVGAASLLVYLLGFSFAYRALDAGSGALILFGMVQITMFAGALAVREFVPRRRWIGSALAFLGLIYLLSPGSGAGDHPAAAGLMVLAGIGWGIYSLSARGNSDPLGATAWNFLIAVPAMFAVLSLLPAPPDTLQTTPSGVALATLSGAVTSGLGYALWYAVLPAIGPSRGGVAQLTVPIIALLGGMIFLGEALTLRFLIAAVLVLGGVTFAVTGPKRQS